MVAAGRLPSSQRVRIRVARGKTSVIGGPFAQTKELVGGFAIFDLKSKEEAIESGRRFMQIHAERRIINVGMNSLIVDHGLNSIADDEHHVSIFRDLPFIAQASVPRDDHRPAFLAP